ncbi:hypothetical protein HORIV_34920 [Vreelandella olivaria]|uniref:Uncharacterized protein n=1 Tax=Vreelandella olivaria TaxID=390919 RepID=A0ABN5WVV8_9GAMM|nr:hypothetical protein HORIV_34920 [Halomonas olivaria]
MDQIREGKQIVERRIFMKHPLEKPNRSTRKTEGGYSENRENPIRDPEGGIRKTGEPYSRSRRGYSENREEGFRVRGSI